MKLSPALDSLWARVKEQISPAFVALLEQSTEELMRSGIVERCLKVGDRVPNFTLPSASGQPVTLQSLLTQGPVVLSFFQGGWCPFCRLELIVWQEKLSMLQRLGASVVAISPQMLEHSWSLVQQHDLSYNVLSDRGNQVGCQFGLVYRLPDYLHPVFEALEHPLPRFNGDDSYELPITGTFVIDRTGSILYAFAHADFTQRAEPTEVITVLQRLAVM